MTPIRGVPTVWATPRSPLSGPLTRSNLYRSAAVADGLRKSHRPPPDSRSPWKTLQPPAPRRVSHSYRSRGAGDLED